MSWPFEWFFNGKFDYIDFNVEDYGRDEDDPIEHHVNWYHLEYLGWESCYADALEYEDIPQEAGIYVVIHEYEKLPLYVGQSKNLSQRINLNKHHKISKIVELWEDSPMGMHNKGNVRGEMRIFWKTLRKPYFMNSLERNLILCESIAIGLLCPLAQGNIKDVITNDWAIGMQFYE